MKTLPAFVSTQVTEARRFFLDLSPKSGSTLTVVCGGVERCGADYHVVRKKFPFMCVEFVADGEGSVILNGREFRLRPGMVFSYRPGVSHEIVNGRSRPMLKYYVDFVGSEAERLLARSPLWENCAVHMGDPRQVLELFELLQENGSGDSRHRHEFCAALVPALLVKISEQAISGSDAETGALLTFQRCKQYIEKNCLTLRTLEEVAAANRLDPAYLCRLFQRFEKSSPYQYLLRRKMNGAAQLLLSTDLLVKEVAEKLNFEDPYNFSRAFKLVYGMSPQHFVRQSWRSE
jgi:AraC-like DNA-binding protein